MCDCASSIRLLLGGGGTKFQIKLGKNGFAVKEVKIRKLMFSSKLKRQAIKVFSLPWCDAFYLRLGSKIEPFKLQIKAGRCI